MVKNIKIILATLLIVIPTCSALADNSVADWKNPKMEPVTFQPNNPNGPLAKAPSPYTYQTETQAPAPVPVAGIPPKSVVTANNTGTTNQDTKAPTEEKSSQPINIFAPQPTQAPQSTFKFTPPQPPMPIQPLKPLPFVQQPTTQQPVYH